MLLYTALTCGYLFGVIFAQVARVSDTSARGDFSFYREIPYTHLFITGSDFHPQTSGIRFGNGVELRFNETIQCRVKPTELYISFPAQSVRWFEDESLLPLPLIVLDIDSGSGYQPVNHTHHTAGVAIAMFFKLPRVLASHQLLSKKSPETLHIFGSGFTDGTRGGHTTRLWFYPDLEADTDYTLKVLSRNLLEVSLVPGRVWRRDTGVLTLASICTIISNVGVVGSAVPVAEIVENVAISLAVYQDVQVVRSEQKVYQSALQQTIVVSGYAFHKDVSLLLEPPLQVDVDYTMRCVSPHRIELHLKDGKKWHNEGGELFIQSISSGGKTYTQYDTLFKQDGIRIATVLVDPVVVTSQKAIYNSQSKVLSITVPGFRPQKDVAVTLDPPDRSGGYSGGPRAHRRSVGNSNDVVEVSLGERGRWFRAEGFLGSDHVKSPIPIYALTIDTGAGLVTLAPSVQVATIVPDLPGVKCDDSCQFAFNGVCNDNTMPLWNTYDATNYTIPRWYGYYEYCLVDVPPVLRGQLLDPISCEENQKLHEGLFWEEYKTNICSAGTDCTDCGGVDAIVESKNTLLNPTVIEQNVNDSFDEECAMIKYIFNHTI